MTLAVRPPVAPMLAKLARVLPVGSYAYEPKWDGFRCMAFRDGDDVDLRSRHDRPFARYFPELVTALREVPETRFVLDGEIVVTTGAGFDFDALLRRLHPAATQVARMMQVAPATFIAFDILAIGDDDMRADAFDARRARLERLLTNFDGAVVVTPLTRDVDVACHWLGALPDGVDGVVAKRGDLPYEAGKRAMVKVKPQRSIDCVVAGCRLAIDAPLVTSLLLGLYDDDGQLLHVGVASSFARTRQAELAKELAPYATDIAGHPWEHGFALEGGAMGRLPGSGGRWRPDMEQDWVPLRPRRVCEVEYTQVDRGRFRHPARFLRWRPDREPASCRTDQLDGERSAGVRLLP